MSQTAVLSSQEKQKNEDAFFREATYVKFSSAKSTTYSTVNHPMS